MTATNRFAGLTAEEINTMLVTEERVAEQEQTFKGHKVADLRKVMNAIQNPDNWKAEWAAAVPYQIVPVVMAAVEFFHADRAEVVGIQLGTGKVLMQGQGYQC